MKRYDVRAILADPTKRKRLMVGTIIATQAREGILTTETQAQDAYAKATDRRDHRNTDHKARDLARQFFRDYPILDTPPKQADDTSTEPGSQS